MATGGKRRVALIGTGHRGAGTWGKELLANCGELVDLVGLCDSNSLRLERARKAIGIDCADLHRPRRDARRDQARNADRLHARRHA